MKASAAVLLSVFLYLFLSGQAKDLSVLLTVAVCCGVAIAAVTCIEPIFDFIRDLSSVGNLNRDLLQILLKTAGIGILAEFVCLICTDAGNAAMGKTIQFLSGAVILSLSIPLFQNMMELLKQILSEI